MIYQFIIIGKYITKKLNKGQKIHSIDHSRPWDTPKIWWLLLKFWEIMLITLSNTCINIKKNLMKIVMFLIPICKSHNCNTFVPNFILEYMSIHKFQHFINQLFFYQLWKLNWNQKSKNLKPTKKFFSR